MGSGLFLSELLSEDEPNRCSLAPWGRGIKGEGFCKPLGKEGSPYCWGASSPRPSPPPRGREGEVTRFMGSGLFIWNCPVNMNLAGVKSAAVIDSRYSRMDCGGAAALYERR